MSDLWEAISQPRVAALTQSDLDRALASPEHFGFGYAQVHNTNTEIAAEVDEVVVRVANELGLSYEDFFIWLNSKNGRWLSDGLTWPEAAADIEGSVRGVFNQQVMDELLAEENPGQPWDFRAGSKTAAQKAKCGNCGAITTRDHDWGDPIEELPCDECGALELTKIGSRRRMASKVDDVWAKMNDSEKHGVQFGLFPSWVQDFDLSHEETVELMGKTGSRRTAFDMNTTNADLVTQMIDDYQNGGGYDNLESSLEELKRRGFGLADDALYHCHSPNGSLSALWGLLGEIAESVGVDRVVEFVAYGSRKTAERGVREVMVPGEGTYGFVLEQSEYGYNIFQLRAADWSNLYGPREKVDEIVSTDDNPAYTQFNAWVDNWIAEKSKINPDVMDRTKSAKKQAGRRGDLDPSVAFSLLLELLPGFAERDLNDPTDYVKQLLDAWYASDSTDMYEFTKEWLILGGGKSEASKKLGVKWPHNIFTCPTCGYATDDTMTAGVINDMLVACPECNTELIPGDASAWCNLQHGDCGWYTQDGSVGRHEAAEDDSYVCRNCGWEEKSGSGIEYSGEEVVCPSCHSTNIETKNASRKKAEVDSVGNAYGTVDVGALNPAEWDILANSGLAWEFTYTDSPYKDIFTIQSVDDEFVNVTGDYFNGTLGIPIRRIKGMNWYGSDYMDIIKILPDVKGRHEGRVNDQGEGQQPKPIAVYQDILDDVSVWDEV